MGTGDTHRATLTRVLRPWDWRTTLPTAAHIPGVATVELREEPAQWDPKRIVRLYRAYLYARDWVVEAWSLDQLAPLLAEAGAPRSATWSPGYGDLPEGMTTQSGGMDLREARRRLRQERQQVPKEEEAQEYDL